MRFQRLRDPIMVIPLVPWFIPEQESVLAIAMKLHRMMEKAKDSVYVLACIELGRCVGISVVYLIDKIAVYWQANTEKGFKYSKQVVDGLKNWARGMGADKMWLNTGCETRQRLYKRYGFMPCKDGMECVL